MKQAGTKQGTLGFWMIPFIPQRDYLLPHSPLMALPISSLVLHGAVTPTFHFSARWLISCSSLFRHSLFLHIRVYVGFFNAPSILSLPAAFFYKWQHLDSNRKEKKSFSVPGAATCFQPPELSCSILLILGKLWNWIWWNSSESFIWTVYIFFVSPSQSTMSK